MEEEIIVNDVGNSLDFQNPESLTDDTAGLPTSLIVTNIDDSVFENDAERAKFEQLFQSFGDVSFIYFKSFRRVRINYQRSQSAAAARIQLHHAQVGNKLINCYFAQISSPKSEDNGDGHLQPPTPIKQYLISPPASPPVGWEPMDEAAPIINYDLLAALANLTPGGSQELHPPSASQPGIVVHHACEEESANGAREAKAAKIKIPHTPRPQSN